MKNFVTQGKVRLALPEDASELQRIYAYYVVTTSSTFEIAVPTKEEFAGRIAFISKEFPYLVYQENGRILGYAYAHRCFDRAAYAWCAETTVYLDHGAQRRGLGGVLYDVLLEFLTELGYKNLYAVVTSENIASCRFHEKKGFQLLGVFRNSGWKLGRWLDVSWYEKQIGEFSALPTLPKPISDLSSETIKYICNRR